MTSEKSPPDERALTRRKNRLGLFLAFVVLVMLAVPLVYRLYYSS